MFFQQIKNLLPKKPSDGAALKTLASQHLLSGLRGLRKQRYIKFPKYSKIFLVALLSLYFSGYQPVLSFPPIKQTLLRAEFSQDQSIDYNHLSQPFKLPHPGYLTTRFSFWHPGIDIAVGLGTPIRPISAGKVTEVSLSFWGLGHYVVIDHEQGFRSIYGHMGRIFAKTGNPVTSSSIIGEVGLTGHTSGPHTHLEITKNEEPINPLTILPAISNWPAGTN